MSLDSVALLVEVENFFDLSFSNSEAETIYTIQDFADAVFSKVVITPASEDKSQILFERFRVCLKDRVAEFHRHSKIKDIVSADKLKETWRMLESELAIKLPPLSPLDFDRTKPSELKLWGIKVWTRKTAITDGTIEDLIHWTIAQNYKTFIDPKKLGSKNEIELALIGLISESVGIPVDEIRLEHSLTSDLGID